MNRLRGTFIAISFIFLNLFGTSAHAVVECTVTPSRYYVGDGIVWIMWKEGGAGISYQSSADFKPILASVLAAITTNRTMVVRYADGTACSAQPAGIVGLWFQ